MLSTFREWGRYLLFSIRTIIIHRRWPGYVVDDEGIAREIFSSHCYKADGSVRPIAFSFNRKKPSALSVNRASLASQVFLKCLALKHAKGRKQTYYGSAHSSARNIRNVVMGDTWAANVIGSINPQNPFHADIPLPPDNGKDFDMDVQRKLATSAIFRPVGPG
jgi:hypothetical protein